MLSMYSVGGSDDVHYRSRPTKSWASYIQGQVNDITDSFAHPVQGVYTVS